MLRLSVLFLAAATLTGPNFPAGKFAFADTLYVQYYPPPPGYGYPPSGYGQPAPGYGYPPSGYSQPGPGYGYPPGPPPSY